MALTETDRDLIKAAAQTYRHRGAESAALEAITGLSTYRAYQRLNRLLGDPIAWAAEPVALGILSRRRGRRSRLRGNRQQPQQAATG